MKAIRFSLMLVALCVGGFWSNSSFAVDWIGGNGNYTSTVPPNAAGWDTAVPDGVGADAQKVDAVTGTVTMDIAATLGSFTLGGANNVSFGITPTAGLTLDEDGAGPGKAIIANNNTSGGNVAAVLLNAGTVTLADDLLISNTSNSSRTAGAITISSTLVGTPGSVTIESVGNAFPVSTGSYVGGVRLQTGVNTFTAPVTINKGVVTFSNGSSFGDANNMITIGQAGAGLGATLISTAAVIVPQDITVVAGTGGTTIVGSNTTSTTTTALGYSGDISLLGDLTITGASLIGTGPNFSGAISGPGALTHFGNAAGGMGNATLSGDNTMHTGKITVDSGSLHFAKRVSLYGGDTTDWSVGNLLVKSGGVATFYVGGMDDFTAADIDLLKNLGNGVGGFQNGSGIGFNTTNGDFAYAGSITNTNANADSLGVVKYGTNKLTLSGTNSYTGPTVVAQGAIQFAKRAALYNDTPAMWTAANLHFNPGTTAIFNVGASDEFTAGHIDTLIALGTSAGAVPNGGFYGTRVAAPTFSSIGFDTTNAPGGTFTYNTNIASPNGGANTIGLTKVGDGTLLLGGTNTYLGSTIVDGGTLRLQAGGSHVLHLGPNPTDVVTSETGNYRIGSVAGATGSIIFDGFNLTSDNGLMVGENGTGSMTLNSGTIILKNDNAGTGHFLGIGRNANSVGNYEQYGGDVLVGATGTSDWFVVGVSGKGTAKLEAGTIKSAVFQIAQNATAEGTFTMNGGAVTTSTNFRLTLAGATSKGTFNMNGGLLTTGTNLTNYSGEGTINQTGGEIKLGTWLTLGENTSSTTTFNMSGGKLSTGTGNIEAPYQGNAEVNLSNTGEITVGSSLFVGRFGTGVLNQSGGSITTNNFSAFGREATGVGTHNMSGGTLTVPTDLNYGDIGVGTLNQTGGTITAGNVIFGYNGSATGSGTIDGANAVINATGTGGVYIGNVGQATVELKNGTINVTNVAGDFRIASGASLSSIFTQSGGTINVSDQSYVGLGGLAQFNMNGGTFNAGDNLFMGANAGSSGTYTQMGGTMTVLGNEPSYTGNVVMGRAGVSILEMKGGTLDIAISSSSTLNSLSHSINNPISANIYELAQDGNLMIGERTGAGTLTQTGGVIKVAANVFVGSINVLDSNFDGSSTGMLTISAGEMHVGVTSPTGGDLVIGGSGVSNLATGEVKLEGGLLDVSRGTGKIGAALGTPTFSFTGGTLKAKVFNAPDFGGNLGNLLQNGTGSLLDVTGNSTTILSSYNLGAGTATIGGGRELKANGVINSDGAGVINVGSGTAAPQGDYNGNGIVDAADFVLWRQTPGDFGGPGGYTVWRENFGSSSSGPGVLNVGAGAIDVDTLNLNVGTVTANGGVTVAAALTGNGTVTGNTTMGAGASVSPGLSGAAGELSFANDLTLNGTGTLNIQIGGGSAGQFDTIDVAGLLTAGGTLNVSLINGFVPTAGQAFEILDWGTVGGSFTTVPPIGNWDTSTLLTDGMIKFVALGSGSDLDGGAVPEPAALGLLVLAAIGVATRRTMRRR